MHEMTARRLLITGCCICLLMGDLARADWPMRHHDPKRTALASGVSDISRPAPRWRYYLGGSLGAAQYQAIDVNADGSTEVVFVAGGRLIAKEPQYDTIIWQTELLGLFSIERITDLDQDGSLEIVAKSSAGHVYVLATMDGSVLWHTPEDFLGLVGSVRFVDVDADGLRDMYVTDSACGGSGAHPHAAAIYSFADGVSATREICRLQPAVRDYYCGHNDALLDIDGDSEIEVLALGRNFLYTYQTAEGALTQDPDGNWICPLELTSEHVGSLPYGLAKTDFADVDSDGLPEVFLYTNNAYAPNINSRRAFMVEYDPATQALVKSWEHSVDDLSNDTHRFAYGSLADLEGDGQYEVTTSFHDSAVGLWTLYVYEAAGGTELLRMDNFLLDGLADLDADGEPEVLAYGSGELHAFDFSDNQLNLLWSSAEGRPANAIDHLDRLDRSAHYRTLTMDVDRDGSLELITRSGSVRINALNILTGELEYSYEVPEETAIQAWEPYPNVTLAGDQILVTRSDGHLVVLGYSLEPTNEICGNEICQVGMRTGGYYTGMNGWGYVAVAGDVNLDAVDDVFVRDSRGVLLWLDTTEASWTQPPGVVWSRSAGRLATMLQWDQDPELELAIGRSTSIEVLDFDGGSAHRLIWSTVLGTLHLDPLPLDVDGDGDLDLFVSLRKAGGLGAHNVLLHEDGSRIWPQDYETVVAGSGFGFSAAVDLDGDGQDDAISTMRNAMHAFKGSDGTFLGSANARYGSPIVADADLDDAEEVLSSGPVNHRYMFEIVPGNTPPLETGWTVDDPEFYTRMTAAVAPCGTGLRLIQARYLSPRLLLIEAASGDLAAEPVLAGGRMFASIEEVEAAGLRPGFLGNVTVHENLAGDGPVALTGSTDGFLYAVSACDGQLVWAHNFRYPVGESIFADTDGDGLDEILTSVADGYLYELGREVFPSPENVFDSLCDQPATSIADDIDEVETADTLCGAWEPVAAATSYLYTVVTAGGSIIIAGDRPNWLETTETFVSVPDLPIELGQKYFFVVMALGPAGSSVQAASDGQLLVDVSGPTLELSASETEINPEGSPSETFISVVVRDSVGLKSGRIEILDQSDQLVVELSAWTSELVSYFATESWTGLNTSGQRVPDGAYQIKASARDLQDRETVESLEIWVVSETPDGGSDGQTDGGSDASVPDAGGDPSGVSDEGGMTAEASGCGCASGTAGGGAWLLLVMSLLLALRSARRESR